MNVISNFHGKVVKNSKSFHQTDLFKGFALFGTLAFSKILISNFKFFWKRINIFTPYNQVNPAGWVIIADGCKEYIPEFVINLFKINSHFKFLLLGSDQCKLDYNFLLIKSQFTYIRINKVNNKKLHHNSIQDLLEGTNSPISFVFLNSSNEKIKEFCKTNDEDIQASLRNNIHENIKILSIIQNIEGNRDKIPVIYLKSYQSTFELPFSVINNSSQYLKTKLLENWENENFDFYIVYDFIENNVDLIAMTDQIDLLVKVCVNLKYKRIFLNHTNLLKKFLMNFNPYLKSLVQKRILLTNFNARKRNVVLK